MGSQSCWKLWHSMIFFEYSYSTSLYFTIKVNIKHLNRNPLKAAFSLPHLCLPCSTQGAQWVSMNIEWWLITLLSVAAMKAPIGMSTSIPTPSTSHNLSKSHPYSGVRSLHRSFFGSPDWFMKAHVYYLVNLFVEHLHVGQCPRCCGSKD